MLQSEAGYIDARPQVRQLDEILLQRTAGPYMWVNSARDDRGEPAVHVPTTPKADANSSRCGRPGTVCVNPRRESVNRGNQDFDRVRLAPPRAAGPRMAFTGRKDPRSRSRHAHSEARRGSPIRLH
jgi:hypothetical protein